MRKYFVTCMCLYMFFIPIQVKASDDIYIGGDSVGIEVQYDGVMVSGTYSIQLDNGMYDPLSMGIQIGDIIKTVNGIKVSNLQDLHKEIAKFTQPINDIPIIVQRVNQDIPLYLKTVYSQNDTTFQSGLYVKDKIVGVGTMSFFDPLSNSFGALGHEIMDSDTKEIAQIEKGVLYSADVSSITKAQRNIAGEKHASINYNDVIGEIQKNTDIGIYGQYTSLNEQAQLLPWAKQEEIRKGSAQIYTVLSGDEIQPYDIEITTLHTQDKSAIKGIEFTITDPDLLAATNGVIQGMSGSPIVQDGKIIGAITHVITSQPSTGYGVYIEWMIEQARQPS